MKTTKKETSSKKPQNRGAAEELQKKLQQNKYPYAIKNVIANTLWIGLEELRKNIAHIIQASDRSKKSQISYELQNYEAEIRNIRVEKKNV